MLIEKKLTAPWDLLLFGWFDLSSEAPPAAVHREFFGRDGAFRIGPPDDRFDALFDEMKVQLDGERLVEVAERIDAHCFDEALAHPHNVARGTFVEAGRVAQPAPAPRYSASGTVPPAMAAKRDDAAILRDLGFDAGEIAALGH